MMKLSFKFVIPICNKLETLADFANSLDVANNELYICIFQLQALQSLKSICMSQVRVAKHTDQY